MFGAGAEQRAIFHAWRTLVAQQWSWLLLGCAVAAVLIVIDRLVRQTRLRVALSSAFVVWSSAIGVWLSYRKMWLADDAFISFRYAQNFAAGHGLVFNKGEWVEGYTNFLWTFLLGLLAKLGADIPITALAGNLLTFVLTIALSAAIVHRASPQKPTVPFAAIALAGGYTMTTWATSGLETMPGAFAVLLAGFLFLGESRRALFGSSIAFAAATLTRPDHLLFFAAAGLALALDDALHARELQWRKRMVDYVCFVAPFVVIYGAHFLWRWQAYGDVFPNTYYAKSGGQTYASQGSIYFLLFLATSGAWAWAFVPALLGKWRGLPRPVQRYGLLALFGSVAFCAYVIRVGGDFMLNRFFVSVLPLAATAVELGLRHRLAGRAWRSFGGWVVGTVAVAACAAAVVPLTVIGPWEKKWNVAAEESFYKVATLRPLVIEASTFRFAQRLTKSFTERGLRPTLGEGCVGMIAYYSDLPMVDRYGLTNRNLGHKPLTVRGRPGHEKLATVQDLISEGAVFSLENLWPGREAQTEFRIDGDRYYFVQWDDALVEELSKIPRAAVPPLNVGLADPASLSFYEQFLVTSKQRESVLAALRMNAERLSAATAPTQEFRLDGEEWPSSAKVDGDAFGPGPASGPLKGQSAIIGFMGARFANSFHGGDETRGSLEIPLDDGSEVRFLVGGGNDCGNTYAALIADGTEYGRVCGQNDEMLRTVVLQLPQGATRRTLRVVDQGTGAWGHILVDHVLVVADARAQTQLSP